ncbi:DNA polymerase subunit beta [Candidatus Bathyarchaeota archaeon]|nr:MAG: DNA polymerase subunit beta [Candidatus Bathyarchaeota archaeon]
MTTLDKLGIFSIVHGSIARGDVSEKSDIDIFIPDIISSFLVESALERVGIPISRRVLIQATPTYSIKAYIEIEEGRSISFPLSKLRKTEREFYKFGGEATLEMLKQNIRSMGVDKRLMLIEPTSEGHIESSIIGRENEVAKLLGISVETVLDRVRILRRRDKIGRTGLFIERELSSEETFESALKELSERNPAVRRRLRTV